MKTSSRTQPEKASTSVADKGKTGGRYSLAALMSRLTGLNRKNQGVGIESVKKPADHTSQPTTVPDDDLLERTDFFACLLRNWPPRD